MDETRLYFAVGGWGNDPSVVTDLLGVSATRITRRGDPLPGRGEFRAQHELWALDSPLPRSAPFEEHIAALLDLLEHRPEGTREVARRFDAVFQCASHFETANPGFALPPALVQRVANLGLGFDFDLYVFLPDDGARDAPASPAV